MSDTEEKIQIGEDKFTDLETFVRDHGLRRVVSNPHTGRDLDPARRKGRYSVVVFKSGVVKKCSISGVSRSAYLMAQTFSRSQTPFEVRPNAVKEIYQ